MKKKRIKILNESNQIKVRLDHRTTITIKDKEKLESWLEKYPNAKVMV